MGLIRHLDYQLVMYMAHDLVTGLVHPSHDVGKNVAPDRLGDVLHEPPSVGLVAPPCALGVLVIASRRHVAELITPGRAVECLPHPLVAECPPGGESYGQIAPRVVAFKYEPRVWHRESHPASRTADRIANRVLHQTPQGHDAAIGIAPSPYEVGHLLLRHPEPCCAHRRQRSHSALIAKCQDGHLALLPQLGVGTVLGNRHAEHLGGRLAVDVLSASERLQHPLLSCHPREDPRLDRAEIAHAELAPWTSDEHGADELGQHLLLGAIYKLDALGIVSPHHVSRA